MFKEYATVRVVKLIHTDRWVETGSPSIGDQGTIVAIDTVNDDVWYTVESFAPDGKIPWLAEFTEDELEPGSEVKIGSDLVLEPVSNDNSVSNSEEELRGETEILGVMKVKTSSEQKLAQAESRRRNEGNLKKNKKGEIYSIILSGFIGALISTLVGSNFFPDHSVLIPIIVGGLTGIAGGFLAGNIGEAIAFIIIFTFITVCFFSVVSNKLGREILLSFVIGLSVGNLCSGIYNEYSR